MVVHEPSVTTSTPEALAILFNQWHVHINDFVFKIEVSTIWDIIILKKNVTSQKQVTFRVI